VPCVSMCCDERGDVDDRCLWRYPTWTNLRRMSRRSFASIASLSVFVDSIESVEQSAGR
jgi:hypothetical protein